MIILIKVNQRDGSLDSLLLRNQRDGSFYLSEVLRRYYLGLIK